MYGATADVVHWHVQKTACTQPVTELTIIGGAVTVVQRWREGPQQTHPVQCLYPYPGAGAGRGHIHAVLVWKHAAASHAYSPTLPGTPAPLRHHLLEYTCSVLHRRVAQRCSVSTWLTSLYGRRECGIPSNCCKTGTTSWQHMVSWLSANYSDKIKHGTRKRLPRAV